MWYSLDWLIARNSCYKHAARDKKSKINQVSQLEWSAHIDPKWPAKALVWLASYPGNEYLGKEVSLRDEAIRQQIGMV